ncbi:MAG: response regulator [Lachnospiraceae bacterium]|nr:response regulator [Lachnospiraceae bacterium]MBQ9607427.1 response regulator [Lachnospiraceae bacterium]MBR1523180.1 response regulator [Lachnospiraceae bacterium]
MGRNALIISAAETFSVRGLEMKLKGIDVNSSFAVPKIKDLEVKCLGTDLIILYTDESTDDAAEALVYLKDYCLAHDEQIIVIGAKSEYDTVGQFMPASCIRGFFERPLEMERFLDEVENYLSDASAHEKRKSILIVDDDVSYMSMIFDWLKDTYRVSMANSGMQAITWLAKNHADLILLDYEMPITSGPQVLEMIKSEAQTSEIPVMFLTGKNDKESIMRVLSLKPADYLLKTIDKKGLRDKLEDFFLTQTAKKI